MTTGNDTTRPMQPEAAFKRRIVASFERNHADCWYSYLVKGPGQRSGFPDLYFMRPRSRPLWMEAKTADEGLSDTQIEVTDWLHRCGDRIVLLEERSRIEARYRILPSEQWFSVIMPLSLAVWDSLFAPLPREAA